jgi:hypothetical protein
MSKLKQMLREEQRPSGNHPMLDAQTPLEVYHAFVGLSNREFHHLKNAASSYHKTHPVYDYDTHGDNLDSTQTAHMADISHKNATHHELANHILDDAANGGSFFKSLKHGFKKAFSKKVWNPIGKALGHAGMAALNYAKDNPELMIKLAKVAAA